MSHVTQDGEDDKTSKDGSSTVGDGDDHGIAEAVVLKLVLGGEGDETVPGRTQGVEDLDGSTLPYFGVLEEVPLGGDEELDALDLSLQGDAPDEEDEEDDVGEGGGEVDNLA